MNPRLDEEIIQKIMDSRDNFDLFVKTQIYAEFLINEAIKQNITHLKIIDSWSFGQKVTILNELGWLPDEFVENLKTMAELRNKFAHNLEVTESEIHSVVGRLKSRFERKHFPSEQRNIHYSYTEPVLDTLLEIFHSVKDNRKPNFT